MNKIIIKYIILIIINMDILSESQSYAYDEETKESVLQYLSQLNNLQKKAYLIAKEHLGSSFHLLKSNGYLEWQKEREKKRII